jgi:plasmid stabilization system protein ParE
MSLPIVLRAEAEHDVRDATDWYDSQRRGLSDGFLAELEHLLKQLSKMPEMYPVVSGTIRAGLLRRYPYVVYHRVLAARIEVLAVLHGSRDTSVWESRK